MSSADVLRVTKYKILCNFICHSSEPARAEGIKVSVNGDRYMFSVLSPSGSELKYTWFQNDTVTSSTSSSSSSLTVPDLPRGTTRVKVSISNQIDSDVMFMDSSSTMFTDNVTIEVTHLPLISCQCASKLYYLADEKTVL